MEDAERVEIPVVERAVVLVLERADGVRHALDRIGLAVRPVVHRVDAPRIARALVRRLADPVHDRVPQVDVAGGHVDLRPQRLGAVGELAGAHAAEEVEALVHGAIAMRRFPPGLGQRAAVLADLIAGEIVHVGLALADELFRPFVEPLEVVAGVVEVRAPVEAEPADVRHDGVHVLLTLLGRVGVVEAQIAAAAVVLRQAEVQADGLGVADVQVAVRLGREARDHLAAEAAFAVVRLDDLADEVGRAGLSGHGGNPITDQVPVSSRTVPGRRLTRGHDRGLRGQVLKCSVPPLENENAGFQDLTPF